MFQASRLSTSLTSFAVWSSFSTIMSLVLNPFAAEFSPRAVPPGLLEAMEVSAGPPGVHADVHGISDAIPLPQGLTAPPGNIGPPVLFCPPGLNSTQKVSLADCLDEKIQEQESKRWSQWARGTVEEINELRQHVQTLETRDVPSGSSGGAASGSSSELLETLSEKISTGLANSEVKALRSRMYFVYFVVAMLVAMTLSLFFTS